VKSKNIVQAPAAKSVFLYSFYRIGELRRYIEEKEEEDEEEEGFGFLRKYLHIPS